MIYHEEYGYPWWYPWLYIALALGAVGFFVAWLGHGGWMLLAAALICYALFAR